MKSRKRSLFGSAAFLVLTCSAALVAAPAVAQEGDASVDGDTYTEVIFDRWLGVFAGADWTARCPNSHPWLRGDVGTPGVSLGQGIRATSTKAMRGIITTENAWKRDGTKPTDGRGGWLISKTEGTVANINDGQQLKLEMVCTNKESLAWNTR